MAEKTSPGDKREPGTISVRLSKNKTPLYLDKGTGVGYLHPDVHYLGTGVGGGGHDSENRFFLYYTPYPYDKDELPFLMVSKDGFNFTDKGIKNPLFERGMPGEWDDHHLADVDVVQVDGDWYMYYAGASIRDGKKNVSIGVALSKDGIKWEKYDENPVLSPDDSPLERGLEVKRSVATPAVVYHRGTFYMWYSAVGADGVVRILLATSRDGFVFKKYEKPVLVPEEEWEGSVINHCDVVYDDRFIYMLYLGQGKKGYSLGLAVATWDDPFHFVKHPSNPVLTPSIGTPFFGEYVDLLIGKFPLKAHLPAQVFWDSWRIYRSCFLSDERGRMVCFGNRDVAGESVSSETACQRTMLYYSAYNFLGSPSIGVTSAEIEKGTGKRYRS